jgi:hypothetical protein
MVEIKVGSFRIALSDEDSDLLKMKWYVSTPGNFQCKIDGKSHTLRKIICQRIGLLYNIKFKDGNKFNYQRNNLVDKEKYFFIKSLQENLKLYRDEYKVKISKVINNSTGLSVESSSLLADRILREVFEKGL